MFWDQVQNDDVYSMFNNQAGYTMTRQGIAAHVQNYVKSWLAYNIWR